MNIIFLDIDGVLTASDTYEKVKEIYDTTGEIKLDVDEDKVKELKRIVDETNSNIVLTTSWRMKSNNKDRLIPGVIKLMETLGVLRKYGLTIYSVTPVTHAGDINQEIKDWLDRNGSNVENYTIFDGNPYKKESIKKLTR